MSNDIGKYFDEDGCIWEFSHPEPDSPDDEIIIKKFQIVTNEDGEDELEEIEISEEEYETGVFFEGYYDATQNYLRVEFPTKRYFAINGGQLSSTYIENYKLIFKTFYKDEDAGTWKWSHDMDCEEDDDDNQNLLNQEFLRFVSDKQPIGIFQLESNSWIRLYHSKIINRLLIEEGSIKETFSKNKEIYGPKSLCEFIPDDEKPMKVVLKDETWHFKSKLEEKDKVLIKGDVNPKNSYKWQKPNFTFESSSQSHQSTIYKFDFDKVQWKKSSTTKLTSPSKIKPTPSKKPEGQKILIGTYQLKDSKLWVRLYYAKGSDTLYIEEGTVQKTVIVEKEIQFQKEINKFFPTPKQGLKALSNKAEWKFSNKLEGQDKIPISSSSTFTWKDSTLTMSSKYKNGALNTYNYSFDNHKWIKQTSKEESIDNLNSLVRLAKDRYCEWYFLGIAHRGENGWFSWARHNSNGPKAARGLVELVNLKEKTLKQRYTHIYNFLKAEKTNFNNHSFASFLLDTLDKVNFFKPYTKKDFIYKNGWKKGLYSKEKVLAHISKLMSLKQSSSELGPKKPISLGELSILIDKSKTEYLALNKPKPKTKFKLFNYSTAKHQADLAQFKHLFQNLASCTKLKDAYELINAFLVHPDTIYSKNSYAQNLLTHLEKVDYLRMSSHTGPLSEKGSSKVQQLKTNNGVFSKENIKQRLAMFMSRELDTDKTSVYNQIAFFQNIKTTAPGINSEVNCKGKTDLNEKIKKFEAIMGDPKALETTSKA